MVFFWNRYVVLVILLDNVYCVEFLPLIRTKFCLKIVM